MKKRLLLAAMAMIMLLFSGVNTWAKCLATVKVPDVVCVGQKFDMSVSDYPCDCINYDKVEWIITDPGGFSVTVWGSPLTYVFSTPGVYTVCVKWYDQCTGETFKKCYDVVAKKCCETSISIPSPVCVDQKVELSISNPCDCINYDKVEWIITDPGGATVVVYGSPLTYVFSTVGIYKVCVKWQDKCTGRNLGEVL